MGRCRPCVCEVRLTFFARVAVPLWPAPIGQAATYASIPASVIASIMLVFVPADRLPSQHRVLLS